MVKRNLKREIAHISLMMQSKGLSCEFDFNLFSLVKRIYESVITHGD